MSLAGVPEEVQSREDLERRLGVLRELLAKSEQDHDEWLAERTQIARVLVDVHGAQLAEVGRIAGVGGSSVGFWLGRYNRSKRRRPAS